MKTAIDLSVAFLFVIGLIAVVIGARLGFDVLGLASAVSALAILHAISRFCISDHTQKSSGRGLRATKSIRTIE